MARVVFLCWHLVSGNMFFSHTNTNMLSGNNCFGGINIIIFGHTISGKYHLGLKISSGFCLLWKQMFRITKEPWVAPKVGRGVT